jgi:uncharacterized membrane protein
MRQADHIHQTALSNEFPVRDYATSSATSAVARHPLMSTFASFPTVCFILALFNDIAYWRTANLQWQNFSEWLLFGGLVVGGFVLLFEVIGLLFRPTIRAQGPGWLHAIGLLIVLLLGLYNSFVHARDGWTAVVPEGLILSTAMIVVMIITGWLGHAAILRRSPKGVSHG